MSSFVLVCPALLGERDRRETGQLPPWGDVGHVTRHACLSVRSVYLCLLPLQIWGRSDRRLACRVPSAVGHPSGQRRRASGKETDLGPLKCNKTKRNVARACHLPLFVTSPNLGSLGRSVASLSSVCRGATCRVGRGKCDGERRRPRLPRETERLETWHGRVVYPCLSPLRICGRSGSRLARRLPFAAG